MRLDIDLTFSREEASTTEQGEGPLSGSVKASGKHIRIVLDQENSALDRSKALKEFAAHFAEGLADRGLSLSLESPQGEVLRLGNVSTSVLKRVFTSSRHIDILSLRRLSSLMRTKARDDGKSAEFRVPPPTLWPLVPTVQRKIRHKPTTTHHVRGSGRPRLVLVHQHPEFGPGPLMEFNLEKDTVVIGSADQCDLQLSGTDPVHAEIVHNESDEYVLIIRGVTSGSINPDSRDRLLLRTGSRVQMGPWRLVFRREEYADHGRPFGGRQGGELAVQLPQPEPYA